ncbi:hypothetical protein M0Q03_02190 [bacterium]|jgi:hypothetical protein|nr:hypothetical protein [bacterium]
MTKVINGFVLENEDKIERAIYGSTADKGQLKGGLVEKYPIVDEIPEEELLVAYDKIGGLITKDGLKVKTGSFYDLKTKSARKEPEVLFIDRIDGQEVELDESEAKAMKKVKVKSDELKAKAKKAKR